MCVWRSCSHLANWDECDHVRQCEVLTAESSTEFCCSDKFSSASHTVGKTEHLYVERKDLRVSGLAVCGRGSCGQLLFH